MTDFRSNPTISLIVEVLLLNITFSGFEVCMPSDIQPSANHKFVDILSNGKVNLSSNSFDEIELIQRGLDIKVLRSLGSVRLGYSTLLWQLVQILELSKVIKSA